MARITQETKDETRNVIIKEATQLFKENGYDNTNTRTIAQNCGIAEGTIFNYFANKEEILLAVFDTIEKTTKTVAQSPSSNVLDEIIDIFLIPVKKMELFEKKFMLDIVIAAVKLSKRKNSLIHRLIALDMTYIKQVEESMQQYLHFPMDTMNSKILAEISYSTLATNYLLYLLDEDMEFVLFEAELRNKLKYLMHPYCLDTVCNHKGIAGDYNG